MAKLNPCDGGCWFCYTDDEKENLLFSFEVDSYYHKSCLMKAVKNKRDLEAKAILEELEDENN